MFNNKGFDNRSRGNSRGYDNPEPVVFEFSKLGFLDNKGNLREELMTTEAENIAKSFERVSTAQLRAFFNEIKALKNRLENNDNNEHFERIYPFILMIKSKVQYRIATDKKLEPLKNFLYAGIEEIQKQNKVGKGKEAFENFAIFFETIVGYAYKG